MAAQDYAKMKNADLEALLKERNLQIGGKKADMVARLQEADANVAASASHPTEAGPSPAPAQVPALQADEATTTASAAGASTDKANADQSETAANAAAEGSADRKKLSKEEREAKYQADEKNFASGMSTTDLQQEIERRKKRMAKFNLTDNTEAVEGIKALERALKFQTGAVAGGEKLSGLDTALTMEREKKRGRAGDDGGRVERKKRGAVTEGKSSWMSAADREAAEKRKQRFATSATSAS